METIEPTTKKQILSDKLKSLERDTWTALVINQTIHKTWIPFTAKVGGELTI